jgi:hypothetical protein
MVISKNVEYKITLNGHEFTKLAYVIEYVLAAKDLTLNPDTRQTLEDMRSDIRTL